MFSQLCLSAQNVDEIYCHFRIRVLRTFLYTHTHSTSKSCRRTFTLKAAFFLQKHLEPFRRNPFCKSDLSYSYPSVYWNAHCYYLGVRKMSDKKKSKRKADTEESAKESSKKQKTEVTDSQGQGQNGLINQITESRKKLCESVAEFKFNKKRIKVLSKVQDFPDGKNGVVYWMSRDQRVQGEIFSTLTRNIVSFDDCPSMNVNE